MVAQTITTTVAEDGTIHLPDGAARPGDIVVVQIRQAEDRRDPVQDEDEDLTVLTADTPEKRERLVQQTLAMGRGIRAQLTEEQLESLNGDWLYDENGLPK